ncbi:cold-regulated protein 27 [Malania oleifera]|uniref:cold-regulated protein 27 n=1 Tax=Malania oleifera TaxID=397392 RepID=UPI0025AEBC73|nr:cold-regulated protein 27 [Malania oleifera]
MDDFRQREKRTASWKSGRTRDCSTGLVDQEEASSLGSRLTEPLPTEWTDEKHRLYLKSMEASFVDQLYNSVDLFGWRSGGMKPVDPQSSRKTHLNTRTSSGQLKVLRDDTWQNINVDKTEPQHDKPIGSRALRACSWVQHFKSSGKQIGTSPARQERTGSKSQAINLREEKASCSGLDAVSKYYPAGGLHICHQDSAGSNTEASDQNFIGEDIEGEKLGSVSSAKRAKAVVADASSDDQVVPLSKPLVTEDLPANRSSSRRKRLHSNG